VGRENELRGVQDKAATYVREAHLARYEPGRVGEICEGRMNLRSKASKKQGPPDLEMSNRAFLEWLHRRLRNMHGEDGRQLFMRRLLGLSRRLDGRGVDVEIKKFGWRGMAEAISRKARPSR
jgi:hypothetical protein